jgi:hypothetical protein
MRRITQSLLVLLVIITVASCDNQKAITPVSLIPSENLLTFRIDENTANISAYLEHYYDDKSDTEMLVSLNSINNELQFFNLENGALIKKLPFEMEGDRGVGSISGFYVHNLDSIFLFPSNGNRLFLADYVAKEIKRINYDVPDGYGNTQVSSTYFSAKPYFSDGKLIAKTLYQGSYSRVSNEELSTRNLSYAIDLSNGAVETLPTTYPNDYWSDVKKHFQFSFSASENGYVYSFWGDHSIYISKTIGTEWTKVTARSEYLRGEWEALPLGGDRMDRRRYFAASAHYGNVIYDPFRQVYYRFVYPKIDTESDDDLRQLALYPSKFSIMILDEALNTLGEQFFDSPFLTSNAFVGKEGLYLSINHPENEENQEDYLSFKLLSLEGVN